MIIEKDIRVDKWLWAVRVFKTRSAASEACKKGKVLVNDLPVKPSRALKINDVVSVRRQPVLFSYKVKGLLGKRLSARLVTEYVENITPPSELEKLKKSETFFVQRDRGAGRPTKKERRTLDKIQRQIH
jgi:ribosome-associated heat shock protein Hsp15